MLIRAHIKEIYMFRIVRLENERVQFVEKCVIYFALGKRVGSTIISAVNDNSITRREVFLLNSVMSMAKMSPRFVRSRLVIRCK